MNLNVPILTPTTSALTNYIIDFGFSDSGTILSTVNATATATVAATNYAATYYSQSSYPSLSINNTLSVYFMYVNTGNQPWFDDSSLSSATWRNAMPTHLATDNALNRNSAFDDGWPDPDRPDTTFSAVYNSDGVTLASNQHEVMPGQIVKFSFNVSPASWVSPGVYPEYFQPIIEGVSGGGIAYIGTSQNITVVPPTYIDSYYAQSNYPTLTHGQQASAWFEYQNNGNQTWYDDSSVGSAPAGTDPVHLATDNALNRNSAFDDGWPDPDRPDTTFSAVYNSDGVTLASNQHEVMPGQIVKFSFNVSPASWVSPGVYNEGFVPVVEGAPVGTLNDPGTVQTITVH